MKSLIIYDSVFGNTQRIAEVIANSLSGACVPVNDLALDELKQYNLVVVGCPTYGGRPTEKIQKLLTSLLSGDYKSMTFATFDTRFQIKDQGLGLKILMKIIDYAAPKMSNMLKANGYKVVSSEGFYVSGKKGPLIQGEEKRAKAWGLVLLNQVK